MQLELVMVILKCHLGQKFILQISSELVRSERKGVFTLILRSGERDVGLESGDYLI